MTMKTYPTVEQLEVGVRHGGIENVFVDVVARARVDKQDVVFEMAIRQCPPSSERTWRTGLKRVVWGPMTEIAASGVRRARFGTG